MATRLRAELTEHDDQVLRCAHLLIYFEHDLLVQRVGRGRVNFIQTLTAQPAQADGSDGLGRVQVKPGNEIPNTSPPNRNPMTGRRLSGRIR